MVGGKRYSKLMICVLMTILLWFLIFKKKDSSIYMKSTRKSIFIVITCIPFIVLFLAMFCDAVETNRCNAILPWRKRQLLEIVLGIVFDLDSVLPAFVELWGISITIMIFVIEIARNMKYGITLKRIAIIELGKTHVFILASFYLLLYPIAYVSYYMGKENTLVACWIVTLLGLMGTLFFCVLETRSKAIRKVLKENTIRTLKKNAKNNKEQQSIQNKIDSLSVTDIMLNTDYTNKEERDNITNMIKDILIDSEVSNSMHENRMENVILMNWCDRICSKFAVGDDRQKEILIRYIGNVLNELEKSGEENEKNTNKNIKENKYRSVLYSVQVLVALVRFNNPDMNEVMIQIWKRISTYKTECILYLLLYTEHHYWFVDNKLLNWLESSNRDLTLIFNQISKGNATFDYEQAVMFWTSWTDYDSEKNEMGLNYLMNFIYCLEAFQGKKHQCPNLPCVTLEYIK